MDNQDQGNQGGGADDHPEQVGVSLAGTEEQPQPAPSQEEANLQAAADPYDPKLMEEILKYNKKREEQVLKDKKEADKLRAREKANYQKYQQHQPKKGTGLQPPNLFFYEQQEEVPAWKKPQEVDMVKMNTLFQLAHSLPKTELLAHINGCIRPQTFMDLTIKNNIDIDHIDFYNIDQSTAFEISKIISKLFTDCATLSKVTREIVEDYAKQSCRYLELRSVPVATGSIASNEQYIETVLKSLIHAEQ